MKCRKWQEHEVDWLKDNYIKLGMRACAKHLGRTEEAITHKAHRLGVVRKGNGRPPRILDHDGYVFISVEGDQYALHRKIVEEHLGRPLTSDEIVHHIDGDKTNNTLSNLEVVNSPLHMHKHPKVRNHLGQFS